MIYGLTIKLYSSLILYTNLERIYWQSYYFFNLFYYIDINIELFNIIN